jgi:hypothetical protein
MSKIALTPNASGTGTFTIAAPNSNTNRTLTLPDVSGEVFSQGNILGTVSETGGVPTGAIIERGSNANGEFVKYADGTMICTKFFTGFGPVNLAYGSAFRSATISTGSPASNFSTVPFVFYTVRGNTAAPTYAAPFVSAAATSLGSVQLCRETSSASTGFEMDLTAIGRWF